jgi:hypothetical protein
LLVLPPSASAGVTDPLPIPHAEYDATVTTHGDADGALIVDRTGRRLTAGSGFGVSWRCPGSTPDLVVEALFSGVPIAADGSFVVTVHDTAVHLSAHIEGRFLSRHLAQGRLWGSVGQDDGTRCRVPRTRSIHYRAHYDHITHLG